MSVEGVVQAGREAAEALMRYTCTISAPVAGQPVYNPDTDEYEDPNDGFVYQGKCRVQVRDGGVEQTVVAGDSEVSLLDTIVSVPISAVGVEIGHVVTIDTAPADGDPDLVDATFRVAAHHRKSDATARRLRVEEVG